MRSKAALLINCIHAICPLCWFDYLVIVVYMAVYRLTCEVSCRAQGDLGRSSDLHSSLSLGMKLINFLWQDQWTRLNVQLCNLTFGYWVSANRSSCSEERVLARMHTSLITHKFSLYRKEIHHTVISVVRYYLFVILFCTTSDLYVNELHLIITDAHQTSPFTLSMVWGDKDLVMMMSW